MEFLQQGPIETTNYMIAGYAVIFGVMLIYLVSLVVRHRSLKQDIRVLQDLDEKEQ
jgi:hypothetical protein